MTAAPFFLPYITATTSLNQTKPIPSSLITSKPVPFAAHLFNHHHHHNHREHPSANLTNCQRARAQFPPASQPLPSPILIHLTMPNLQKTLQTQSTHTLCQFTKSSITNSQKTRALNQICKPIRRVLNLLHTPP
jgi:hypothetical protein